MYETLDQDRPQNTNERPIQKGLPDLRLFAYALASAEHRSFRKAADALNIQQSTVSRGVRSLEDQIGARLFARGHAGIRPTTAGETFLRDVTLGLGYIESAVNRIGSAQRGRLSELKVAASLPFFLLGDIFQHFRNEHVGVSVDVLEETCGGGVDLVQQGEADIAFVTEVPPAGGGLRSLHLRNEQMVVVLPRAHRLKQSPTVLMEELKPEQLIFGAGALARKVAGYIYCQMARSGAEPDIKLHDIGPFDVVDMVARGCGITVAVGKFPHLGSDSVAYVPLGKQHFISVHAVWFGSNGNMALRNFLRYVRRSRSIG